MPSCKTIFLTVLSVLLTAVFAEAQEQSDSDSLVRLNYGKTAELLEIDGQNVRKVIGPAEFLHNNTYMLCDTALWNMDTGIIDAVGNVSLIQEGTVLTSDKMKYIVDEDLAQFRGSLVELVDSDNNVLRTSHLDYNTKDSVGVFDYGGSMRDKDGQLIESIEGTYDSKAKLFTFVKDVNMFTDSIFVKTTRLEYRSDLNLATFGRETDAWKDDNMLSADAGWYDRDKEIFFFRINVHVMNDNQEGWSDSLYFYRNTMDVDMRGRAQVSDSARNVSGLAGRIIYTDSLSRVTMLKEPAVLARMEGEQIDTVYVAADTIIYYTMRMCDISAGVIDASEKRVEDLKGDPVGAYREQAAEERRRKEEEAMKNDPNYRSQDLAGGLKGGLEDGGGGDGGGSDATKLQTYDDEDDEDEDFDMEDYVEDDENEVDDGEDGFGRDSLDFGRDSLNFGRDSLDFGRDSLNFGRDSLDSGRDSLNFGRDSLDFGRDSLNFGRDSLDSGRDSLNFGRDSLDFGRDSLGFDTDSLGFATDSIAGPLDTTKVNFLWANGHIRLFREDMQMVCDSLEYCDLDSLTRLYRDAIIWNEVTQQYSADSVMVVFRNGAMEKANLMSESYIIIEEEKDVYFDQIKSVEAIAYFDSAGELSRFDALGSATGAFFLREEEVVATVNKTDSKMLSAVFEDGAINKVYYFQDVKSDAYPVVQLPKEEQTFKGFLWQPERRPDSPQAVTTREPKPNMRGKYKSHPRAAFDFTEIYFPGYIPGIYIEIQQRDSIGRIRAAERREAAALREAFLADSLERENLYSLIDSVSIVDTLLLADSLSFADSLSRADRKALRDEQKREKEIADSLSKSDSVLVEKMPTKEELKEEAAKKKAAEKEAARKAREAARQQRIEDREARWAILDSLDAAKDSIKVEKKAAKQRQKKLKVLTKADEASAAEEVVLEKYVQKIEKREAKKEEIAVKKALKEAEKKKAKKTSKPAEVAGDGNEPEDGDEAAEGDEPEDGDEAAEGDETEDGDDDAGEAGNEADGGGAGDADQGVAG